MAKTKITKRKGSPGSRSSSGLGDQKCTFCPKTFATKDERNKHLVECAESRLFCEFCHFNTNKLAYLRKHVRKIHCSAECDSHDSAEESGQDIHSDTESVTDGQKGQDENNNKEVVKCGEKTVKAPDVISIADSQNDKADESTDRNDNPNSQSLFDNISSDDDLGEVDDSVKETREADDSVKETREADDSVKETREAAKPESESKSTPEIQTQTEDKSQSLLEGRLFSKKTRPTPVVSGKRGKCIPLKYQKKVARKRPVSSTPMRNKSGVKQAKNDSSLNASASSGPLDDEKPSTSRESLESTIEPIDIVVTPDVQNPVTVESRGTQTDNVLVTQYMEIVTTYREGGKKFKITEWKERM